MLWLLLLAAVQMHRHHYQHGEAVSNAIEQHSLDKRYRWYGIFAKLFLLIQQQVDMIVH